MNIKAAGDSILKSLNAWSKDNNKLVVGIDGAVGVGKTTVSEYIENHNPSVLLIHIDDFMTPLEYRSKEVNHLSDPTEFFIHNWFEYQELRELISMFRSGKVQKFETLAYRNGKRDIPVEYDLSKSILIIEGALLFHTELINDDWDKRIFLDGDEEEIRQRRVAREKQRWGDKYISEDDPNSWFKFILAGLKKYSENYKPHEKADLTIKIT